MKRILYPIAAILLLLSLHEASAGVLYARRPGTESPVYNLYISKIRTSITIVGQLAITHVDEEFFNDNTLTLEGFYAFQLPEGAKVDGLWLWVDGKRLTFIVKTKEDAERMYDSVVIGQRKDPAILESLGANRFQLKVFPILPNNSRRIEMQYFNTLPMTPDGFVHYRYPLNMKGYQTNPVSITEMKINVQSKQRITDFSTSFDDRPLINKTTKFNDYNYAINFGIENQNYTEDYTLQFRPEGVFSMFPALSWKDPADPNGDGYFITWHPERVDTTTYVPHDLVFVLDGSGSMVGTRIEAVKTCMKNILPKLGSNDRFRLVLFSSNAISFPADSTLVDATPQNVADAIVFIDRYYDASGLTNYEAAFTAALEANFRPDADKRMLFLTDGEPTAGVSTSAGLLNVIQAKDRHNIRIYPIIYYSATIQLLFDIASARGGKVTSVDNSDNLETVVSRLMLDLSVSGIVSPSVKYNNGKTYQVYPLTFPYIVSSDQLVTTGRYFGDGQESATLTFIDKTANTQTVTRDVDFTTAAISLKEVGAYWAGKRIDDLLAQIALYGATPELKNSVINLSIKHQVLSPYTAFLVLETNPIDPTGVDETFVRPYSFALHAAYPSPLSLSSGLVGSIPYEIAKETNVRIVVYDLLGRVIKVLVDENRIPGRYTALWEGLDNRNLPVLPGMYIVSLKAGSFTATRKIVVVK